MRQVKLLSLMLVLTLLGQNLLAQVTFQRNGVYDEREGFYAFTNATIFKSYNEKLENDTQAQKWWKIAFDLDPERTYLQKRFSDEL